MSKKIAPKAKSVDKHVSVPIRMPEALETKITEATAKTGLAKQDVMRLSLERGIDILIAQLTSRPAMAPEGVAA
jgi:hypothetical protein